MEFAEILKSYLEIGLLGLCGCLIIYFAYINIKRTNDKDKKDNNKQNSRIDKKDAALEKRFDSMLELIQQQNQMYQDQQAKNTDILIQNIINGIVNHVPSQEENIKLTKITEEIDTTLNEILKDTEADRANLVQYHNGGKSINKQAFLKMSMTNEQVKFGVKAFMPEFKDQFRSVLSYFTKKLNDDGYCYIEDVDDLKNVDNSMYDFMKVRGVKSKFGIAIKDHNDTVIAFISIEFINKVPLDITKIDRILKDKQKVMETLLSL